MRPPLEELTDAAADLSLLYTRIGRLTPEPGTPGVDPTGRGMGGKKISASPAPWNDEAAGWIYDVHAGVREHKLNIGWLCFAHVIRQDSNSDLITHKVIHELPALIDMAWSRYGKHRFALDATRDINMWGRSGRAILDETRLDEVEPIQAPPVKKGLPRPKCVECGHTLTLEPDWEHEPHLTVHCKNTKAHLPLSWRAEFYGLLVAEEEATA